jgi:EpsI family protein
MGQVSWIRAIVACVLLLVAATVVNQFESQAYTLDYPVSLESSNLVKSPWRSGRQIPIADNIVEALNLDDYLYRQFFTTTENVDLYIGFYHSGDKIGDAHDPLVCFQGQGWVISDRSNGVVDIPGPEGHQLNYSALVATHGEQQEYVFYWFQSFNSTESSTHQQKLKMFMNKISGQGTSNAFVRVTTDVKNGSMDDAFKRSIDFVQSFYPSFHNYVTQAKR